MTFFEVLSERCSECLYGPNKVVREERRKQLLRNLDRKDGWFICHKATIAHRKVACRGDWDQRGCGQMGRVAERLGVVTFVDEADLA
jgi:hypothetical protein